MQFIPREDTIGDKFSRAFSNASSLAGQETSRNLMAREREKAEQSERQKKVDAVSKLAGRDASGLDDKMLEELLKHSLGMQGTEHEQGIKNQHAKELQQEKYGFEERLQDKANDIKSSQANEKIAKEKREKIAPYASGLKNLTKMRQLLKKGNLGLLATAKTPFSSDARKERAEYEQLGKSLISLASTIPIRNQLEFETLSHDLYNPSNTKAKIEGTLNAMERIIKNSMMENEEEGIEETASMEPQGEIVEMRDSEGNVYDIPLELQEQARAQGLM